MKGQSLIARIGFAFQGCIAGWRRERSFRIQALTACIAVFVLILLRPAPIWWGVAALTAAAVLALELVNAAVEALCDLLHPEVHPEVKFIKDVLAGAVLMIALGALAVTIALVVDRWPVIAVWLGAA